MDAIDIVKIILAMSCFILLAVPYLAMWNLRRKLRSEKPNMRKKK